MKKADDIIVVVGHRIVTPMDLQGFGWAGYWQE
jgi:hypothetical protein